MQVEEYVTEVKRINEFMSKIMNTHELIGPIKIQEMWSSINESVEDLADEFIKDLEEHIRNGEFSPAWGIIESVNDLEFKDFRTIVIEKLINSFKTESLSTSVAE